MRVLNELRTMNDKDIQAWLRRVGRENAPLLAAVLTRTDETVKDCVFRNMSNAARTRLAEAIGRFESQGIGADEIERSAQVLRKFF